MWVRRICSDDEQFELEATSLYKRFLNRGYLKWVIIRALAIARSKDRKDLLEKRTEDNNLHQIKLTHFTPYSVEFGEIRNIINKHLPMLYSDEVCASILGKCINAVPQIAPTLGRTLSPSFFNNSNNTMKSVT